MRAIGAVFDKLDEIGFQHVQRRRIQRAARRVLGAFGDEIIDRARHVGELAHFRRTGAQRGRRRALHRRRGDQRGGRTLRLQRGAARRVGPDARRRCRGNSGDRGQARGFRFGEPARFEIGEACRFGRVRRPLGLERSEPFGFRIGGALRFDVGEAFRLGRLHGLVRFDLREALGFGVGRLLLRCQIGEPLGFGIGSALRFDLRDPLLLGSCSRRAGGLFGGDAVCFYSRSRSRFLRFELRGNRGRGGARRFFGGEPVADAVVDDGRSAGRGGLFGGDARGFRIGDGGSRRAVGFGGGQLDRRLFLGAQFGDAGLQQIRRAAIIEPGRRNRPHRRRRLLDSNRRDAGRSDRGAIFGRVRVRLSAERVFGRHDGQAGQAQHRETGEGKLREIAHAAEESGAGVFAVIARAALLAALRNDGDAARRGCDRDERRLVYRLRRRGRFAQQAHFRDGIVRDRASGDRAGMGEDRQRRLRAHRVAGAQTGAERHRRLGALFGGAARGFGLADRLAQAFRQRRAAAGCTVHRVVQHDSHLVAGGHRGRPDPANSL